MQFNRCLSGSTKRLRLIFGRKYCKKSNSSNVIRQQFLDFFIKENRHEFVKSSSVIPFCDKTLSFTNAGMNQFKNIFLGTQAPKYKRAANSQKCIRVGGKHNDLSVVGTDSYHHTFFEMLGNWSFGDYFKKEACEMAWKLLTEVYKIPPERLYVTYFRGEPEHNLEADLECRDIWLNIGVKSDRIIPFGTKENFWEMGKTGPCGRCTEIHIDHLPSFKDVNRATEVNMDKSDLTELWNLVFIENFRKLDGTIEQLQEKHIDTGMGFERLVAFLQGRSSNYDTDLFLPIFKRIEKVAHCVPYTGSFKGDDYKRDTSYRIMADHSRMIAACLADGMFPEQNQKLRRILRKCINISMKHFGHNNLLLETVPVVTNILGDTFPELHQKLFTSLDIIKYEEEYLQSLRDSLSKGIKEIVSQHPKLIDLDLYEYPGFVSAFHEFKKYQKSNKKIISGDMTFQLYSTFGLDLDLIEKLAEIENMTVDLDSFGEKMEQMKGKALGNLDNETIVRLTGKIKPTENECKYEYRYDSASDMFLTSSIQSRIVAIFDENGNQIESSAKASSSVIKVVAEKSPFYFESGGQESDTGSMKINECTLPVESVNSQRDILFHTVNCVGTNLLKVGDVVELKVDDYRRTSLIRNHSATHLLNSVIRHLKKLPIYQKSSLVTCSQLKIELAMIGPKLYEDDLREIEEAVRNFIKNQPLERQVEIVNSQELQSRSNVVMVPGEIYPNDNIKVISFGDISNELCCGTHVTNTREIKEFTFSSVKSTGRASYLFTGLTADSAKAALITGNDYVERLINLHNTLKLENFADALNSVRKVSAELNEVELSHLKRLECFKLIDSIKDHIKNESRNALSELLDIEMKSVIEKHSNSKFIVHFLACSDLMKNVSLQKATRMISDEKAIIAVSLADEEVKARCCVPKELVSEHFDAEKWLRIFSESFKSKVEPPKGQNKLEVCFMKGRKIKPDKFDNMLQAAIESAEKYALENCK